MNQAQTIEPATVASQKPIINSYRPNQLGPQASIRLWIDLDNSPHVPLFAPLISYLNTQDRWELIITARDFAQTLDLVEQMGIDAVAVGRHAGRNKFRKVANLPVRAVQLLSSIGSQRPDVALSHGSRTQAIASRIMGIPQIVMFDYEWTELRILSTLATALLCPKALDADRLRQAGVPLAKVSWYDGYKEDLYLPEFVPDPSFRSSIGIGDNERLITVRPPGMIGNYHDPRSEDLCRGVLIAATADPSNHVVVLPKTRIEREFVRTVLAECGRGRVTIPERALPGLQLLYFSDIAISGGGTMNREAALLGVPTWSIFTGRRGAVDEELALRGMLRFVESPKDISNIDFSIRRRENKLPQRGRELLYDLSNMIATFAHSQR